ncbi:MULTISPECIES: aminomethyl transferase family protein [Streptomyces]|uniref:aminomethyl transferase family protein n=1 Tax=Streptomyces TaxID=1883 RepID=UPI002FDC0A78
MTQQTLNDKLKQADGAVRMLRASVAGAYPYPIPAEYTNWRDEQAAWRQTAVLFDQSHHMTDVYFRGPDTRRLLSDTGINGFTTFGRNKAKQFVAVNHDGRLIGDSVLFGLEDDEFSLVGGPVVPNWVAFRAETGGYDVEVRRDERTLANPAGRRTYRYQLQGPKALEIVAQASGGSLPPLGFFKMGEFTIAGCPVRGLNHTMTGIPGQETTGLELWGPAEHGPQVLQALLDAGEGHGMVQGGATSYATTAVESGWIGLYVPALYSGDSMRTYRDHLRADSFEATASLVGSFDSADIEDYYLTPWDLGYDRLLRLDHDFIGRDALESLADQPHRRKVWLRWNDDDVTRVMAANLFGGKQRTRYLQVPYATYGTLQYDSVLAGDRIVGISNRTGYTVGIGHWASLAMIEEPEAVDGREVTVLWGEPDGGAGRANIESHVQTEIRATISTAPLE